MTSETLTRLAKAILLMGIKRRASVVELRDSGVQVRLMYLVDEMWVEGMTIPDQLHARVVETLADFASIDPRVQARGTFDWLVGPDEIGYHFELEVCSPTTFRVSLRLARLDPRLVN